MNSDFSIAIDNQKIATITIKPNTKQTQNRNKHIKQKHKQKTTKHKNKINRKKS